MLRFKELIELWRKDNSLTRAFNESKVMLETTHEMFGAAVRSLRQTDSAKIDVDVYKMDRKINAYERGVRKKVLKHLAITGGVNIIPGLILTSIVIDIERIGDYTKNIKDMARAHPERLTCGQYNDDVSRVEAGVEDLFKKVLPLLKSSNSKAAGALMEGHWWILKKCDEIVTGLLSSPDPDISTTDAVATALYSRYLKRTAAHLLNVASGIANPFERIGFRADTDDET